MDAAGLNYKAGDTYQHAVCIRSNQPAIFLDSTGRCYSLPAHTLPSARGQGEPLTGRFSPPAGSEFIGVVGGNQDDWWLLSTDGGYGFQVQTKDLTANKKAGKTVLSLPKGARVMRPMKITDKTTDRVVAITNIGRMLVIPLSELPELTRGKGNKIIGIPGPALQRREEFMVAIASVPENGKLKVISGKRHIMLRAADLNAYEGERGRRGNKLPRGFQKVDAVEVEV